MLRVSVQEVVVHAQTGKCMLSQVKHAQTGKCMLWQAKHTQTGKYMPRVNACQDW